MKFENFNAHPLISLTFLRARPAGAGDKAIGVCVLPRRQSQGIRLCASPTIIVADGDLLLCRQIARRCRTEGVSASGERAAACETTGIDLLKEWRC